MIPFELLLGSLAGLIFPFFPYRARNILLPVISLSMAVVMLLLQIQVWQEGTVSGQIEAGRFLWLWKADLSAGIFLLVFNLTAFFAILHFYKNPVKFSKIQHGLPESAFLWMQTGLSGMILANDVSSFLIFWEMMSVASFIAGFFRNESRFSFALTRYFIQMHIGAGFLIAGFSRMVAIQGFQEIPVLISEEIGRAHV